MLIKIQNGKEDYMEFLIGIFVGALLYYAFAERKKPSGVFTIDLSDPMIDDICELTMYEGLNEISMKKRIILDVKTIMENSPK